MAKASAGLMMFRHLGGKLQVLLVHPGGPFWRKRDAGAWMIPKGELRAGEDALATAQREFEEETGIRPQGPFIPLTAVKQKGGKTVHAWAFQGDCDPGRIQSNTFAMEWPPKSGKKEKFPEIDQAGFFGVEEAKTKINPAQIPLIDELEKILAARGLREQQHQFPFPS